MCVPLVRYYVSYLFVRCHRTYVTTQLRVATSAPEAELFEIYRTSKQLVYLKGLLGDMGEKDTSITILTDSDSSVKTVHNPISSRYKYLSVYVNFLKQQMKAHGLSVIFLSREHNFADLLTKQNTKEVFEALRKKLWTPFKWTHRQEAAPRR